MWYFLHTKTNLSNCLIEIENPRQRTHEFFILNKGNGRFLQLVQQDAKAQSGLNAELLSTLDLLETLDLPIPIVSKRFVEKTEKYLNGIVEYYPLSIACKGKKYPFYLMRVLNTLSVVDEKRSGFLKLNEEQTLLDQPTVIKKDMNPELLLVKDTKYSIIIASQRFKEIAEKEKLQIAFTDTTETL